VRYRVRIFVCACALVGWPAFALGRADWAWDTTLLAGLGLIAAATAIALTLLILANPESAGGDRSRVARGA
jgi:hypothetical protein